MSESNDQRPLLVLDLDETLIHARTHPQDGRSDAFYVFNYHVYQRPGLELFLERIFESFRVAVWTSSGTEYANQIVESIFSSDQVLEWVWCSDRCTKKFNHEEQESYWLKNFAKLRKQGWNLDQVIAIDDSPEKHQTQYGNLVQVKPWLGEREDNELHALADYLNNKLLPKILSGESVRSIEKRGWRKQTLSGIGKQ